MDSAARSTSRRDPSRSSGVRGPAGPVDPRTETQAVVAQSDEPEIGSNGSANGIRRSSRNGRPGGRAPRPAGVLDPRPAADGQTDDGQPDDGQPDDGTAETPNGDGPERGPRQPSKGWATLTKLLLGPGSTDADEGSGGDVAGAGSSTSNGGASTTSSNGVQVRSDDEAQRVITHPGPAPTAAAPGSVLLPPIRTNPAAFTEAPTPNDPVSASPDVRTVEHGTAPSPPSTEEPTQVLPDTVNRSTEVLATRVLVPPPGAAPSAAEEPAQLERRPARASVTFQRRSTRPRVRRVTRVVRHIDTWSVFKVALVFSVFLYAVALTAGVLLWHVAMATGTIDNIERFFEGFGWKSFQFKGGEIYHSAWISGLFVAVGLTGLAVLLATLFNLITDLVGGVRVSVLEEEVLARRDRTPAIVLEHEPDEGTLYDQARHG